MFLHPNSIQHLWDELEDWKPPLSPASVADLTNPLVAERKQNLCSQA